MIGLAGAITAAPEDPSAAWRNPAAVVTLWRRPTELPLDPTDDHSRPRFHASGIVHGVLQAASPTSASTLGQTFQGVGPDLAWIPATTASYNVEGYTRAQSAMASVEYLQYRFGLGVYGRLDSGLLDVPARDLDAPLVRSFVQPGTGIPAPDAVEAGLLPAWDHARLAVNAGSTVPFPFGVGPYLDHAQGCVGQPDDATETPALTPMVCSGRNPTLRTTAVGIQVGALHAPRAETWRVGWSVRSESVSLHTDGRDGKDEWAFHLPWVASLGAAFRLDPNFVNGDAERGPGHHHRVDERPALLLLDAEATLPSVRTCTLEDSPFGDDLNGGTGGAEESACLTHGLPLTNRIAVAVEGEPFRRRIARMRGGIWLEPTRAPAYSVRTHLTAGVDLFLSYRIPLNLISGIQLAVDVGLPGICPDGGNAFECDPGDGYAHVTLGLRRRW